MPISPTGTIQQSFVTNPVTGQTNPAAAAVQDSQAVANVALEAVAMLNASGTFDRLRAMPAPGIAAGLPARDLPIESLLTQILDTLRALLYAAVVRNIALAGPARGGPQAGDDFMFADYLAKGTAAAPADPNTLQ